MPSPRRNTTSQPWPPIERAGANDLAMLAMDRGPVPVQVGAVLLLDAGLGFDVPAAQSVIDQRIRTVPRLRQRLVAAPFGCGRDVWIDDPEFDIEHHVRHLGCSPLADEQSLLDIALTVITDPLPRSWPLWSMTFITGAAGGRVALVIVMHHVLADGLGGLAVLQHLVDGAPEDLEPPLAFPRRPPSAVELAVEAFRSRLEALPRIPSSARRARMSLAAAGGVRPVRVEPCSLLHPTGPRRRMAVVHAELADLRAAAHRQGGTVNDAVLTAVTGALKMLMERRRESVDDFAVTVPVATRRLASAATLGNQVSPLVVRLPGAGDAAQRLQRIAETMRERKSTVPDTMPVAMLGPMFKPVARYGAYHWYMNHQRRFHTLVTSVRGPEYQVTFADKPVRGIVPIAVGDAGNVTVSFDVMSYADMLSITAVVDPDRFPDLPYLTEALRAQLDDLRSIPDPSSPLVRSDPRDRAGTGVG
jgi:diacylglycerol O-acyltransferase / wax synthase